MTPNADDEYRLAGWDKNGPIEKTPPSDRPLPAVENAGDLATGKPETDESPEPFRGRPPLPPRPFLTGTFSFPLASTAWTYTLALAIMAMLIAMLAAKCYDLGNIPSPGTWLICALLVAFGGILALMCFSFVSACGLAVVRDTANGVNKITGWPGFNFIDWFLEPLYLFDALCVSMLPGVAIDWLLFLHGHSCSIAAPICVFFLFPFVLLSMLEHGSPLGAVSLPVCRSLFAAAAGWAAFYLTSGALLAVGGIVTVAAFRLGGLPMLFASFLLAVVWFIYFRLLGRLAWYCADRMALAEPKSEPDDDFEELHVQEVEMFSLTYAFCPRCGKRVEVGRVPVGAKVACTRCKSEFAIGTSQP